MRYQQYIKEEQRDFLAEFYDTTGDQYSWDFVKKMCAPWFKATSSYKEILWRGMKNKDSYGIHKVRGDREPTDTPKWIHDRFGASFKKQFGWNPREEGIFCSADEDNVGQYGSRYIIFPIGEFKFVWSPRIKDLFTHISLSTEESVSAWASTQVRKRDIKTVDEKMKLRFDLLNDYRESRKNHTIGELYGDFLDFLTGEYGAYKDTDLPRALSSDHEIMIKCNSYFYFVTTDFYMLIGELLRRHT